VRRLAILLFAVCLISWHAPASAQQADDPFRPFGDSSESIVGQFEGFGGSLLNEPVTISARWIAATADRPAVLAITADVAPGKHL
jgi:hypothetical protein